MSKAPADKDKTPTTGFKTPPKLPGASDIAHVALQLAALSARLSLEERTLVNHVTGRPENVSEHSNMLAIVAPAIAEIFYPHLDVNLISRMASIHDAVEAYSGDTPTYNIDEKGLKQKALREAEGLARLKSDYANLPKFVELINSYEAQQKPEARFVRLLDKWMPVLMHFADQGVTIRAYTTRQKLLDNYVPHAKRLKTEYPEFEELIVV